MRPSEDEPFPTILQARSFCKQTVYQKHRRRCKSSRLIRLGHYLELTCQGGPSALWCHIGVKANTAWRFPTLSHENWRVKGSHQFRGRNWCLRVGNGERCFASLLQTSPLLGQPTWSNALRGRDTKVPLLVRPITCCSPTPNPRAIDIPPTAPILHAVPPLISNHHRPNAGNARPAKPPFTFQTGNTAREV